MVIGRITALLIDIIENNVVIESSLNPWQPSWRHLPNQTNVTMIVYEEEDVDFKKDLGWVSNF